MEKLQNALNKARQQRGGGGSVARNKAPAAPQDGVLQPTPAIWDALTPFEPNPDLLLKNRVMTLNAQVNANPFDVLRTKIFLLMRQNGWTRIAVTSPTKSCGKTTTACNLAVGFSRQRENRTMLFDFDLRRPGVGKTLGYKAKHGVKSLLTRNVPAEEQMVRLRSNVAISAAKAAVSDPTQLLLAEETTDVLNEVQTSFALDVMIFDLPPMLITDDARAFLKNVDCALIVARADQTRMNQLDVCEREVGEHTNVLGVVLNDCRHVSDEEAYYEEY